MPTIQEIIEKPKFQKVSHRPWDSKSFEKNIVATHTSVQDLEEKLLDLGNSQKYIMEFLVKNVNESKISEEFILTNRISSLDMNKYTRIPVNTITRCISLLKKADIISTFKKKSGKGGYAIYKISKDVYNAQKEISK